MQKIRKVLVHKVATDGKMEEDIMDIPCPSIRTHYTSRFFPKKGEINNQPSMTIPDQAMTVMEIMQRFASGLPISAGKVPLYEEEEGELSELQKMDLTERQDYISEKMEEIKTITKRVNDRKQQAAEMRLQKIIEERIKLKQDEEKPQS